MRGLLYRFFWVKDFYECILFILFRGQGRLSLLFSLAGIYFVEIFIQIQ